MKLMESGKHIIAPASDKEIIFCIKNTGELERKISIVPIGQGSTLRGKEIENRGSHIFLSSRNMKNVIELARENLTITVQSGITLHEIDEIVEPEGLVLVRSPLLRPDRTIGGVVAEGTYFNKEFNQCILGLKAILPNGDIIKTGGKTVKNASGYDLKSIFIGSRGILGFISEITLKLQPVKSHKELIVCCIPICELPNLLKLIYPFKHYFTFLIIDNVDFVSEGSNNKTCKISVVYEGSQEAVHYLRDFLVDKLTKNDTPIIHTNKDIIKNALNKLHENSAQFDEYITINEMEVVQTLGPEMPAFIYDVKARYLRVFKKGEKMPRILNSATAKLLEQYTFHSTYLQIKKKIDPDMLFGINTK
ncbi:FAD-binding protein [Thermanaerosceptrum fracticalcis]|uniref:FAD-binding protein n=1 Tax=Thermanaerosceptrum fracticalcis TaxID=1712410 RepID=A0A7G6E3F9_THEFR|nr:FAD-binding oxidoreductase [Thermanaerosceptrum fracticalcis]QNB46613.1 FAD-binding protein [Thermanaerosceptrum fracticalcis]